MMRTQIGAGAAAAFACAAALAGGSPENILIVVNPASAESMYIANYYRTVRNVPSSNFLYIRPTASDVSTSPAPYSVAAGPRGDLDALAGALANARLGDHIDYIVIANSGAFYTDMPGLVVDGCFPVNRISQSSLFTTAFIRNSLLAGGFQVGTTNQYFSASPSAAAAFSANSSWLGGAVSTSPNARRYYIAAQLGYTGLRGNTLGEVLTMIDRAASADGTHPPGTFYFMNTTDTIRNVRSPQFAPTVADITGRGGNAVVLNAVLPDFTTDNLGILTGWPDPPVDGSAIAPQPGSFCDHLTSWAATFDNSSQVKLSSWIRRGAAGSAGAVEEPCNYTGKFIHANFHAIYFRGLSLGESYLRSNQFTPIQSLLVGDPMSRPWATFPTITSNAPTGALSGTVSFTPAAATTLPGAAISSLTLYIDGVRHSTRAPGQPFTIKTDLLPDGWHELRILAADNTAVRNTGRWVGSAVFNNAGRSATLQLDTTSGTLSTLFSATTGGAGGTIQELRLIQNGRVVAAAPGPAATLSVFGRNLGAGRSTVQTEAIFAGGHSARSAPIEVDIAYTFPSPSGQPPVAYSYTKHVARGQNAVVELPARFDDPLSSATWTVISPPSQGTIVGPSAPGYRVLTIAPNACGPDTMTFRVNTVSGQSGVATVNLIYGPGPVCPADVSGEGNLNIGDFSIFLNLFASGDLRADIDLSCQLNIADFSAFLNAFATGCP